MRWRLVMGRARRAEARCEGCDLLRCDLLRYLHGCLLLASQPLHFGDYGGLALKILWALLDIATIVILGSGLYLWLGKGRRKA